MALIDQVDLAILAALSFGSGVSTAELWLSS
jgi:hypothetical protein